MHRPSRTTHGVVPTRYRNTKWIYSPAELLSSHNRLFRRVWFFKPARPADRLLHMSKNRRRATILMAPPPVSAFTLDPQSPAPSVPEKHIYPLHPYVKVLISAFVLFHL